MKEYFEKEEENGKKTDKWKLKKEGVENQYKEIIKYLENPKYIIKKSNEEADSDPSTMSEIVKCHAVLQKLSKKRI